MAPIIVHVRDVCMYMVGVEIKKFKLLKKSFRNFKYTYLRGSATFSCIYETLFNMERAKYGKCEHFIYIFMAQ